LKKIERQFKTVLLSKEFNLMKNRLKFLIRTFFGIILIISAIGCDQRKSGNHSEKSRTKTDASKLKNISINYILPSPAQLFTALERVHQVNWSGLVTVNKEINYSSDIQSSLNIGCRSADGLVLVYAGDIKGAKDVWTSINALSSRLAIDNMLEDSQLGVKAVIDSILEKQQAGQKSIDPEDSKKLRHALDQVHGVTEKVLRDSNNSDLALLVSLGGWIEGFYLVTQALSENYNENSARLLRMSSLVDTYQQQLSDPYMDEAIKKHAVIKEIIKSLPVIVTLTSVEKGEPLSQESVIKLYEIAKKLKTSIEEVSGS